MSQTPIPLQGHDAHQAIDLLDFFTKVRSARRAGFEKGHPVLIEMQRELNVWKEKTPKDTVKATAVEEALHEVRREYYREQISAAEKIGGLDGLAKCNQLIAEISPNESVLQEQVRETYLQTVKTVCRMNPSRSSDVYDLMQTHTTFLATPELSAWVTRKHYEQFIT